ncbi:hypothetical protein [Paracoccus aminovorans]|uniref:hypothetical protein n=1 Tax=Paracoccus aminovorans TaxID=34004 RepID=UPI00147EC7F6|nr:hypothetical protein [Paracoccus aminovorans]
MTKSDPPGTAREKAPPDPDAGNPSAKLVVLALKLDAALAAARVTGERKEDKHRP